ncbi:restriction endonuclease subunit S [Akkermansiaceae bacterium]|nr:restriction endonuclease subunit S [Akkermansiaceae bacterium]
MSKAQTSVNLGSLSNIRTGKLDANASSDSGEYPFFTCVKKPLKISSYSFDCECVLVAGNGDLNVKYYSGKFDAYQRTYIIETKPEKSDLLDLRYVFRFMEIHLNTLREQSIGGIIKYIKLGNLTEAKIPLPALDEQKRIAAILDAADELRAKRRQTLTELDTLIQSTFLDLFGDPVTNPKGWEECCIGEVTDCIVPGRDKPKSFTGSIPWITTNDLTEGATTFVSQDKIGLTEEEITKVKAKTIPINSVIMVCVGDLGVCSIVGKEFVMNQQLHAFISKDRVTPHFLNHCIPYRKSWMKSRATQTTLPYLNKTNCNSVPIVIPPLELQKQFANIVQKIEAEKARCQAQLDELDTLFASLQSRAFKGEL